MSRYPDAETAAQRQIDDTLEAGNARTCSTVTAEERPGRSPSDRKLRALPGHHLRDGFSRLAGETFEQRLWRDQRRIELQFRRDRIALRFELLETALPPRGSDADAACG